MRNLLKKLIFSFLIATTLFFSFASSSSVKAEPTWYNQGLTEWYEKVYDSNLSKPSEIFGERYTAAQVQWILYSLFSNMINIIPGNPEFFLCVTAGNLANCMDVLPATLQDILTYSDTNPSEHKSLASFYVNSMSKHSLSGIGYLKGVMDKMSPVSIVNAQGVGFSTAGASILPLWKVTRNLSFSLLIVATIVLSFMIMFRVKINPQAVISIQSTIPKIIVAIILITFSYAIAGFVIDLMYVVIALIATIISTGGLSDLGPVFLFDRFIYQFSGFGVVWMYWINLLASSLTAIASSGTMALEAILFFIFAILVILPTIFWSIKILFISIKNFALLMMTIVLGPLQIMMGVLSNNSGFGPWLRQLAMRVAIYPVMVIMIFLSFFFLNQGLTESQVAKYNLPFRPHVNFILPESWLPPFTGMGSKPSVNSSQIIWVLVSYFIFSQITKVAEIVQSFFSGKPFDYGSAIGESLGYARGAWKATGGNIIEGARRDAFYNNESRLQKKLSGLFQKIGGATTKPGEIREAKKQGL